MKPIVIGCLGRAGSGKSTASKYIQDKWNAHGFSFARPVKELAKRLWHFTDEQLYGTQKQKETLDPRWGITPREAMIRLGDEARNVIGLDVWIDACFNSMSFSSATIRVIEDVRYPNEAERIATSKDFHGYVIKLDYADRKSAVDENAPSERSVDEVDPAFIHTIVHHWCDGQRSLKTGIDDVLRQVMR